MKFRICVAACLVLFNFSILSHSLASDRPLIQDNAILTMSDCIIRGLEVNPKIAAKEFEIQKADDEIKIARSGFLPSLAASYSVNGINNIYSQGPIKDDYLDQFEQSGGLTLTQGIFSGFTTMNRYKMKQLEKESAHVGKTLEINSLVFEIQSNFIKILMYSEQTKNHKKAVERLFEKTKAVKKYFDQKMVSYTEVLKAEVELSDAQRELSMVESNFKIQKNKLKTLIGIPFNTAVHYMGDVRKIPIIKNMEFEVNLVKALKIRPEILQVKKKIKIVEKEKKIIKGQYSPEVSINAGYSHIDRDYTNPSQDIFGNPVDRDQINDFWSLGAKVVWPFYEGGKKYYQIKKTENEINRLNQHYRLLVDAVTNEVTNSYHIVEETIKRIEFSKTSLKETSESYKRAEKRFQTNIGTITEVLDAQAKLVEAETNHTLDWCQYALSLANFFSATGQPKYDLINDDL